MLVRWGVLLVASTLSQAITLEYYRSAHCDSDSPEFYLDKYTANEPLVNDKICHKTPARTLAVRLANDIGPQCVVHAYDDYDCNSLVSTVLVGGKCVAATKARIGSWQVDCDYNDHQSQEYLSYIPGELRRRGNGRSALIRDASSMTTTMTTSSGSSTEVTASMTSSTMNVSTIRDVPITTIATSTSPTQSFETGLHHNVTKSMTTGTNTTYNSPSMTAGISSSSTVTFIGTTGNNGTAILYASGASLRLADGIFPNIVLCGMLTLVGAFLA